MNKFNRVLFSRITIGITSFLIGAAIAAGAAFYYLQQPHSVFSFKGAAGWHIVPVVNTDSPDDTRYLALLSDDEVCNILLYKRAGTIDAAKKIADIQSTAKSFGNEMTSLGVTPLTLRTSRGDKNYTLHQFEQTNGMGVSHGYIPVTSGYIDILANCKTSDKLPLAIDAIKAIEYRPAKN